MNDTTLYGIIIYYTMCVIMSGCLGYAIYIAIKNKIFIQYIQYLITPIVISFVLQTIIREILKQDVPKYAINSLVFLKNSWLLMTLVFLSSYICIIFYETK